MGLPLSDQYYLKAVDQYHYDMESAVEALQYALSYDEEHAASHCMMGKIYTYKLKQYKSACHHYEQSLLYDPSYVDAYYFYPCLLVDLGRYQKAQRLMQRAMYVDGINHTNIVLISAYRYERTGLLQVAKASLIYAKQVAVCDQQLDHIDLSVKRLNKKMKFLNKS